jgi:hypothetical protein
MFDYNSITWVPKTLKEHADDILADVNTYLKARGTTKLLTAVVKNTLYIFILAVAGMRAIWDLLLYEAQNSFNPALCSDDQLLSLLPIVGTEIIPGVETTVSVTVTATPAGSCVIPVNSKIYITADTYVETQAEVTISASGSSTFTMKSNKKEALTILADSLVSFSTSIPNLLSITNAVSVAGRADETPLQVRARLLNGGTVDKSFDGTTNKLRLLSGINDARVYFNPESENEISLEGGINLAPRTALILIDGASDYIAETYWKSQTMATQGDEEQTYTSLSGQEFTIYYDLVVEQDVYVKVYISTEDVLSSEITLDIQNTILALQGSIKIGAKLSSKMIDELFSDFTTVEVVGSDVSLNGTDWYKSVNIDANSKALLEIARITVVNL